LILADTSVWVDHLRAGDARLSALLQRGSIVIHPHVIGEIALGTLANRQKIIGLLQDLPKSQVAADDEIITYLERYRLYGLGVGYVDVHLLAATRLTPDCLLWTRDRRLRAAAGQLGLSVDFE
jgi:predicted nucleic acid-binding protein